MVDADDRIVEYCLAAVVVVAFDGDGQATSQSKGSCSPFSAWPSRPSNGLLTVAMVVLVLDDDGLEASSDANTDIGTEWEWLLLAMNGGEDPNCSPLETKLPSKSFLKMVNFCLLIPIVLSDYLSFCCCWTVDSSTWVHCSEVRPVACCSVSSIWFCQRKNE